MTRYKKSIEPAYSGKYITNNGTTYQLVPEILKGYCKGCPLEFKNPKGCNSNLTDSCRQGFILKEVK